MDALQIAKEIGDILSKLLVPIIGYVAWVLQDIRGELRRLSDAVLTLSAWKDSHDRQDDDRHQYLQREMARMRDRHERAYGNGREE